MDELEALRHCPFTLPDQVLLAGTPASKWYDWHLVFFQGLSKSINGSATKVQEEIGNKAIELHSLGPREPPQRSSKDKISQVGKHLCVGVLGCRCSEGGFRTVQGKSVKETRHLISG